MDWGSSQQEMSQSVTRKMWVNSDNRILVLKDNQAIKHLKQNYESTAGSKPDTFQWIIKCQKFVDNQQVLNQPQKTKQSKAKHRLVQMHAHLLSGLWKLSHSGWVDNRGLFRQETQWLQTCSCSHANGAMFRGELHLKCQESPVGIACCMTRCAAEETYGNGLTHSTFWLHLPTEVSKAAGGWKT